MAEYLPVYLTDKDAIEPLDGDILNETRTAFDKHVQKIVDEIYTGIMNTFKKYGYDENWIVNYRDRISIICIGDYSDSIYIFKVDDAQLFNLRVRCTDSGIDYSILDLTGGKTDG